MIDKLSSLHLDTTISTMEDFDDVVADKSFLAEESMVLKSMFEYIRAGKTMEL